MREKYAWRNFGYDVGQAKRALDSYKYRGLFEAPLTNRPMGYHSDYDDLPESALALEQTEAIVSSSALGPPHGVDLLVPPPVPPLPKLPAIPDKALMQSYEAWTLKQYEKLKADLEAAHETITAKVHKEQAWGDELSVACKSGDHSAIRFLMLISLIRHPLPRQLLIEAEFALDGASRVALCMIEAPDFTAMPIVRKRGNRWKKRWIPVSDAQKRKSSELTLQSLCIRAAYLVAMSDPGDFFDTVAVNAHQKWHDPATGVRKQGIVASLQAPKERLCDLQPGHLDPKACFRQLAGISTPNISNVTPVRPIFVMNTDDSRIVGTKDVAGTLDEETNIAAMPWEDFEHLVTQLFEWMFGRDGAEVKVTRASRDRGVDAIMFDPDPIRGGKYVLQAKRYTRTVDVAAVRDLYGTVVNEGANRGILVTTAAYGPDSYDFAKDKPISLIDGAHLIELLKKYGRTYRLDLEDARRLERNSREKG
jgi:restriction system protein